MNAALTDNAIQSSVTILNEQGDVTIIWTEDRWARGAAAMAGAPDDET